MGAMRPPSNADTLSGMKEPFSTRLCYVARRVRGEWPERRLELLEDAGAFDPANAFDLEKIKRVLSTDPTLIDDWLNWSEGKRYSGHWLSRGCKDMVSACAEFIIREAGIFREIRLKKHSNDS
jgi:hypothetical protein